jgi:hypothetical protein
MKGGELCDAVDFDGNKARLLTLNVLLYWPSDDFREHPRVELDALIDEPPDERLPGLVNVSRKRSCPGIHCPPEFDEILDSQRLPRRQLAELWDIGARAREEQITRMHRVSESHAAPYGPTLFDAEASRMNNTQDCGKLGVRRRPKPDALEATDDCRSEVVERVGHVR